MKKSIGCFAAIILVLICESIYSQSKNAEIPFRIFGRKFHKGLKNISGKIIIPKKYDEITVINYSALYWEKGEIIKNKRWYFLAKKGNKSGIYDDSGKNIIPVVYEEIVWDFGNKGTYLIIACKKNDKYGFFDPDGKQITEFIYSEIDTGDFGEYIAYVKREGMDKFVKLDKKGVEHSE